MAAPDRSSLGLCFSFDPLHFTRATCPSRRPLPFSQVRPEQNTDRRTTTGRPRTTGAAARASVRDSSSAGRGVPRGLSPPTSRCHTDRVVWGPEVEDSGRPIGRGGRKEPETNELRGANMVQLIVCSCGGWDDCLYKMSGRLRHVSFSNEMLIVNTKTRQGSGHHPKPAPLFIARTGGLFDARPITPGTSGVPSGQTVPREVK